MKKITELMNLENRKALVTGGAGHIGLIICETLLELGATVTLTDMDETACHEKCISLNKQGYKGHAIPLAADLADINDTKQVVINAANKMGGLNILIHSAAFVGTTKYPGWTVPFENQTIEAWDAAMRVNLTAAFLLIQTAKPYLEESKNASIIMIDSIYGLLGPDFRIYKETNITTPAAYAASKGGLLQLCRYLATLLAPHIRVNAITAGGIWRGQPELFCQRYCEKTPLKRMATEEDFKGGIAYLASDLSAYVTGQNLIIDGGWTAW
ncbi:MAG: SDR family oxidoreductase [Pseudomonadota bacterium]